MKQKSEGTHRNTTRVEHDAGQRYGGDTNYNNLLKVILYDK